MVDGSVWFGSDNCGY